MKTAGIESERTQVSGEGSRIPQISDERLKKLSQKIKPVFRFARGQYGLFDSDKGWLFYIEDVDPRNDSFAWDARPTKRATGLKKLSEIETYHAYGYQGFFKPSIAEVIAQIPKKDLDTVVAFETSTSLDLRYVLSDEGLHVTTTILYAKSRK